MSTLEQALEYAQQLVGIKYVWWTGYDIPIANIGPFWAINESPPDISIIKQQGVCCTGVINLIRRYLILPVPGVIENEQFPGGTYSWEKHFDWEPFDSRVAYQPGTLFLRPYSSYEDQGHIALLLPDDKLIHSYVDNSEPQPGFQEPGCIIDQTWKTSHSWKVDGYYKLALQPKIWLSYLYLK